MDNVLNDKIYKVKISEIRFSSFSELLTLNSLK